MRTYFSIPQFSRYSRKAVRKNFGTKSRRRKSWVVFANDLNHKAGNLRRKS